MLSFALAALANTASATANPGWATHPETGCQYRLSDEKASWYFAVRKCHEETDGAQLASVKNQAEADFVSTISHGADKWIYGFHEDTAWNVDFAAANLWMEGEPGNAAAELRYCAYQHSTAPRVAAGICSQKKHYVCKLCSSPEAEAARRPVADTAHKIDLVIREKRSQVHAKKSLVRAKRSVSSTTTTTTEVPRVADRLFKGSTTSTTTTEAPRVAERQLGRTSTTTTTTTDEPRYGDSGEESNVVNVKAETGNAEASSSESNSSLSGGAIAGMVIGGLLLVLAGIVVGYAGAKKSAENTKAKAEIAAQLQFDDSVV